MRRARKTITGECSGRLPSAARPLGRAAAAGGVPAGGRNSAAPQVRSQQKLKDRDLVFILRNLSTLTESGVSLPKALGTLAEEKALEKHRDMLHVDSPPPGKRRDVQLGARAFRRPRSTP